MISLGSPTKSLDRSALLEILAPHQDTLYAICYHILGHRQDAEDAYQDVLLKVIRKVHSLSDSEHLEAWLYRVAHHAALDLRRSRDARKTREARLRPGASEPPVREGGHDALHGGLAALDDTARSLVLQHYFGHQPLQKLADERGCTVQAVWKRLQSAREQLKKTLGAVVLPALEGIPTLRAPAEILGKAVAAHQGGILASKLLLLLVVAAPLVVVSSAGAWVASRRRESPDGARPWTFFSQKAPPNVTRPGARGETALGRPDPGPSGTAPVTLRPRKPYPYPHFPSGYSELERRTWETLKSMVVSVDLQEVTLKQVLADISGQIGTAILSDPSGEGQICSVKVDGIQAEGCLQLPLYPRSWDFEIRKDGYLFAGPKESIGGGYEHAMRERVGTEGEWAGIRELLDGGWDGTSDRSDSLAAEAFLKEHQVIIPAGETTLDREIARLKEAGLAGIEITGVAVDRSRPFLQEGGERTLEQHLNNIAQAFGLGVVASTPEYVYLESPEDALRIHQEWSSDRRAYQEALRTLDRPLGLQGPVLLQNLVGGITASHGLTLIPTEDLWNSELEVPIAPESTLREALDQLKAQGLRWAYQDKKIYLLK